ncbi:VanZ family protein [Paenibacillus donghaensis]|nr:VanZ family protein [Paenibacillus donghaensis]
MKKTPKVSPGRTITVLWIMFVLYLSLLIRIILFKDAPLYNLLGGIGLFPRTVSPVPMASTLEMIQGGMDSGRLLENIIGNIVLFVPLGLMLPVLTKLRPGQVLLFGSAFSLVLEILQFGLAIGSSDVDDLVYNTCGAWLGISLTCYIRRQVGAAKALMVITVTVAICGLLGVAVLYRTHSSLFKLHRNAVIIESRQQNAEANNKNSLHSL